LTDPDRNRYSSAEASIPDRDQPLFVLWLRSLAFNLLFFGWTTLLFGLVFWWLLPFPAAAMQNAVRFWSRSILRLARLCIGLEFEIRGRENLPDGPCLVACKHQSAWDTFIFFEVFRNPVLIVKQTLMRSPFYGWYAYKCGMIPARKSGTKAMRLIMKDAKQAIAANRPIIIFPEGLRVSPGEHPPLKPGVALLASRISVPVVPAALNSGLFWGRRSFLKRPGTITLEFLPAIDPGLKRTGFLQALEIAIHGESDRLEREAARKISTTADGKLPGPR